MLDRQDIDALLMGALYGELSPSESARLDEHLSAHPQDKLVLDGLTRARQALRDSHVLVLQAEPPAAVSALLLQEAARRAPAAREARVGFFAKLAALLRHPATAAAAAIVLVAGVAGTLYLKGGGVADQERHAEVGTAAPAGSAAGSAAPGAPAAAEEKQLYEGDYGADVADPQANAGGLTDSTDGKTKATVAQPTAGALEAKNEAVFSRTDSGSGGANRELAKESEDRKSKKKGKGYIEVTTPEPQPKTLDADGFATPDDVSGAAPGKPQETAAKPRQTVPAEPSPPPSTGVATAGQGGESYANPEAATAEPADEPRAADKAATAGASASAKDRRVARDDQAAKIAHAKLVALVKSNKCNDAAKAAGQLYTTYPDYYAEFVANDRQIKACKAYIDSDRKRRNEALKSRAKVTNEVDAAAPAPAGAK